MPLFNFMQKKEVFSFLFMGFIVFYSVFFTLRVGLGRHLLRLEVRRLRERAVDLAHLLVEAADPVELLRDDVSAAVLEVGSLLEGPRDELRLS